MTTTQGEEKKLWSTPQHHDHDEDYDDENDSDEDSSNNDDEDDDTSWKHDLIQGWRQHVIAIFIAAIATAVTFLYSSSPPSVEDVLLQKHAHLEVYQRTANVSFCGLSIQPSNSLFVMDFNVPKKYVPSMMMHYAADVLYSDSYFEVDVNAANKHPEVKCLKSLHETSPQNFVKGVTSYYKTPTIESMYPEHAVKAERSVTRKAPKLEASYLTFTGFAAKFVNLSPEPILLLWDGRGGGKPQLIGEIPPFEALGTATTPGQSFSVSPVYDSSHALDRWVLTADDPIMYYDPMSDKDKEALSTENKMLYEMQELNREFAKHYLIQSGRQWLAHFPRAFPIHHMWPADYFGQEHIVDHADGTYKLTVQSVTPRVFTIPNFLSAEECDTLVQLALLEGMKGSTVYSGAMAKQQRDLSTRSSTNTWLPRETANITDRIYRRAATVLRIDESLLQAPIDDDVHAHHHSLAESLQVIRYKEGEEYTAHHDFVYPSAKHRHQPTRFATLLFYLNDDFEGGETLFPRAVNAHFHEGIKVKPVKGTAVLFYGMLPDGNLDDLSQHSSEPVKSGEKFAANLWIWEPMIN